jgi:hypothetical protein
VAALQAAAAAIAGGICGHVLIPIGRTGFSGPRIGTRLHQWPQFRTVGEFELPQGAIAPATLYAPMARRHMSVRNDEPPARRNRGDDAKARAAQ